MLLRILLRLLGVDKKNMKRFILFLIGAIICIYSQAQPMSEFVKNTSYKITYDDFFTPTLHMTVKNISSKAITSIEIIFFTLPTLESGRHQRIVKLSEFTLQQVNPK